MSPLGLLCLAAIADADLLSMPLALNMMNQWLQCFGAGRTGCIVDSRPFLDP